MTRQNKSKYVPKHIILMQQFHLLLVAFLFGTVLYDSFVHTLPFYYVLFGRFY